MNERGVRNAPMLTIASLSRTLGASVDPRLDQLAEQLLAAGRGLAPFAGLPRPGDDVVARDVLVQQLEVAAAVAGRVLDLAADGADRLALPRHLDRGETPARIARNAPV